MNYTARISNYPGDPGPIWKRTSRPVHDSPAPPHPTDPRLDAVIAKHEAAARERQAVNRPICQACPQYDAGRSLCRIILRTCDCSDPVAGARRKTETAQRQNTCPEERLGELEA